jgi:uncharacterized glyoxalase superfamily protein PhnB
MTTRAFPVVCATHVSRTAQFWERLGFARFYQVPAGVDTVLADLKADGITVLKEAADMPWDERIASIADPDGNPVALANEPGQPH